MEYRDYIIQPHSYFGGHFEFVHKEYDGPEDRRIGHGSTVQDCKQQIDDIIFESNEWTVKHSEVLQPVTFTWLSDAIKFAGSYALEFDYFNAP
jgi:hypothetical protein